MQIQIPLFYLSDEDDRTVLYQIHVLTSKRNWILEKRYSHFKSLQEGLKQYFPELKVELPKKKYTTFFVGKSNEELEKRRQGLELYLQEIVKHERILNSQLLTTFLGQSIKQPQTITLAKFTSGLRDFAIQHNLLYILTSEMNAISRFDAYLQNIKLFSNNNSTSVPVATLECWSREKMLFCQLYNSQAICLQVCENEIFVGLDNGTINYLIIQDQKIESSFEIDQHTARVMGLHYYQNKLYTVSKDQHYKVLNVKTQELEINKGHSQELTCLYYCNQRNCAFIGDRAGSIYIYKGIHFIAEVHTPLQFVRDFYIDNKRNYLLAIGYQEGQAIVFDINSVGNEGKIREVCSFKSKSNSRCIAWSASRGEVYIGNDEGVLTVWNAKDCCPILEIKLHNNAITKMKWSENHHKLYTISKDKEVKITQMYEQYYNNFVIEKQQQQLQELDNWQIDN